MSAAPETRYTRSADGTNLAYQVSGEGPIDLLFLHVAIPIDLLSEDPGFDRIRKRLGTFSRTVWTDSRGWGASEGDPRDWLRGEISDADITAVLDAAGVERAALVAEDMAGGLAIHFSVTHPERVSALVLVNSYAHYLREDDYPWGIPRQSLDRSVAAAKEHWDTDAGVEVIAPSRIATSASEPGTPARLGSEVAPIRPLTRFPLSGHTIFARFSTPSRFPPWSCIVRATGTSNWALADTWPNIFPLPSLSSSPATTTCSSWVTPTTWWTRLRSS